MIYLLPMISFDFGQFEKLDSYHLPAHCGPEVRDIPLRTTSNKGKLNWGLGTQELNAKRTQRMHRGKGTPAT